MSSTQWLDSDRGLLVHAAAIVSVSVLLVVLLRLAGPSLIRRARRRTEPLREAVYRSAHSPVLALIMLCGAYLIGVLVNSRIHAKLLSHTLDPMLRAYIRNHPGIDHSQSELVYFTHYGSHSLDILIYCFAGTIQWAQSLAVQEDVLLNASRIIRRHGGQLALPVTRVQMQRAEVEGDSDGQRVASRS